MTGLPVERTLTLLGGRVAALEWGAGRPLRLLALHGWLDNASSFTRLAPLIENCHLVAVDLPGHGHSEWRSPEVAYHYVDWLRDVEDILDALAWEQAVLMGHSMGAGVVSLYGGTRPDRIQGMVLLDGLGPFVSEPSEAPARVLAYLDTRRRRSARRSPTVQRSVEAAAEHLSAVVANLSLDGARLLAERGTRPVPGGVAWRADPRLRWVSPLRLTEEHVRAFLRAVTAPTVLVRPNQGFAVPSDVMWERLACVARGKVADVPGGHHAHLDQPEPVARAVNRFLAALMPEPVGHP